MNEVYLIGAFFLAWSFGRNNMGNIFGTAIGTHMLSLKMAALVAGVCMMLGALISGEHTTANVAAIAHFKTMQDAFIVSVSIGIVLLIMGKRGIPVSISQTTVGALLAWDIFHRIDVDWYLIQKIILAWIYSPFLSAFTAFFIFKGVRSFLRKHPVGIFYRDVYIRIGLICVGAFFSYALGANNLGNLVGPFLNVSAFNEVELFIMMGLFAWAGFMTASPKVIKTISSSVFPLSPVEALVVVFSGALVLFLFSFGYLRIVLHSIGLFSLPMVPVSVSEVVIGAIVGVSLAKGGYGLKYKTLGNIAKAWVSVPILSALICGGILTILSFVKGIF